ncbi:MAG: phosphopyruvate hydratase [Parcubacteria group bacterium]|nr:phosphopyruvate hydratase [Parcubacteria group bacterium]
MNKITQIKAREILDSRGNPTLEVTAASEDVSASFSVPSGASIGLHEALEKRDGDKKHFRGLGVLGAVKTINEAISAALTGLDPTDQKKIDATLLQLDGTANKTNLGGNTIIGVSIACAKLAARTQKKEVFEHLQTLADIKPSRSTPLLYMNLVNGGKHAQSRLAFQEYHVVPLTDDVETALDLGTKIQYELKKKIVESLGVTSANYGDEGGFVPSAAEVKKPLELLLQILEEHKLSDKVKLALDVAASSFYNNGEYEFNGQNHSADEFLDFYGTLINSFPILSIEDPFYEEDFKRFAQLLSHKQVKVVGDDLTVTNPARLKEAIAQKSIDAIIIKPNQIGTLTETLETMRLARENNIKCIISHRSGETSDDFIADLAFAFGAFGLKAGAPHGGERVVKYNRLLEICRAQ